MRGGERDGRYERDAGNPPDQHRQPQAGIPSTQDELAQPVQAVSPQGVPLGAADVWDDVLGGDRGSDHLYPAGRTDLKGGEDDDAGRQDTADA